MTDETPFQEKRQYQHYLDLEEKLVEEFDTLEDTLQKQADARDDRLQRFFFRALIAFAVMGITCAISVFGFGYVLHEQSDTTDKIQEQADKIQEQAIKIQSQRYQATLQTCQDQNRRHRKVNKKIDKAVSEVPESQKAQAEKGAKTFKLIIGASVPKRNCKQRADRLVNGVTGAKSTDDK